MEPSTDPAASTELLQALARDTAFDLTRGFIHDLNNAYAGVTSLIDLVLLEVRPDHPQHQNLKAIVDGTRKAAAMADSFGRLIQTKFGIRNYHDANELLRDALRYLRAAVPRRIELKCHSDDASLPVCLDAAALRVVVFSLTLDAAALAPEKGRLEWTARPIAKAPWPRSEDGPAHRGPWVVLRLQIEISDFAFPLPSSQSPPLETQGRPDLRQALRAFEFARVEYGARLSAADTGGGGEISLWIPRSDFTELDEPEPLAR